MCAIDIFLNKIMKSKFCVKKCQENVLQFMFLYIIRTPPFRAQIGGKKVRIIHGERCYVPEGKYCVRSVDIYLSAIYYYVWSTLIYGCETWTIYVAMQKKIDTLET